MHGLNPQELRGIDQELKEAICDALVNLTCDKVSGRGADGRDLLAASPRRPIVSGQLLPRFDAIGGDDESSDIRIAAIGLDFQVRSDGNNRIAIQPSFSTYIRILPAWRDVLDDEGLVDIDFRLQPQVQAAIDARITQLRQQRFAAEGVERPDWKSLSPDERRHVNALRAAIEDEVRRRAYDEQGIQLEAGESQQLIADGGTVDQSAAGPVAPAPTDPAVPEDQTPSRLQFGRLFQQGRRIPIGLLDPTMPPPKWRRIDLKFLPYEWDTQSDPNERDISLNDYNAQLRAAALVQLRAWLGSAEGGALVWRQVAVMPQDIESQQTWDAYLTRARAAAVVEARVLPDLSGIALQIDQMPNFVDPAITSIRVMIDNGVAELSGRDASTKTETAFDVGLKVLLSAAAHHPLRLDRVEPSYRYRQFLDYPAIGLNCGIVAKRLGDTLQLETTWSPRFVQPRIVPRQIDIPLTFKILADQKHDVSVLLKLSAEYLGSVDAEERTLRPAVREGLEQFDADRETKEFERDLEARRQEARYIERGVRLLMESRQAAQELESTSDAAKRAALLPRTAPWRAWVLTNQAFLRRDKEDPKRGWRLFQLAFILAHIPTLSSRIPEFREYHDTKLDEDSASLLYFSTGGGKSEAFYGTLLFGMFLDRLRGKDRGVTAMVRYPLRLLTLQQGQRLLKLIAHAEMVRKEQSVGAWPFEIGFWVGGANTPNRYSYVPAAVPLVTDDRHPDDSVFDAEKLPDDTKERAKAERYLEEREAYNKVPECPVCGKTTGLRRYESEGPTAKRLAIICFNHECKWNKAHSTKMPLPFLLTDDSIYARAPSIVLGTIDKMAMIGQNTNTIRQLLGMFGLARWIATTGHLSSATDSNGNPADAEDDVTWRRIKPAFASGQNVFLDPFPSLIIQDEAHLLEESLGTFSGIFDSLFENALKRIYEIGGNELGVARAWTVDGWGGPRLPKIIAATATISNPERQLEVLYQRKPLRFPYPGSDIYRSFFALPDNVPAANAARIQLGSDLPAHEAPERTAPWMRLYVSLMTNDATHTTTVVAVLSAFHTLITKIWRGLLDPARQAETIALLRESQSSGTDGDWRKAAIDRAVVNGRAADIMALVDLHRVSLAYVTNKKGGDQVMDALDTTVRQRHRAIREPLDAFATRLISGGVDMKEIQGVMQEAEATFDGRPYGPVDKTLRCIVATSAISHGVDVDRFNSMFFAGLPSDVAEYIQASSRVGRTHVGFVMLVPTPQSRRDRYVVETHDVFHRFLERMIAAPAVERWAENAIKRTMASMVQTWAILKEAEAFKKAADDQKRLVEPMDSIAVLRGLAIRDQVGFADDLGTFVLRSIGFEGHGKAKLGKPVHENLYRSLAEREIGNFTSRIRSNAARIFLQEYWKDLAAVFKAPMTSLRDVDEAGWIVPAAFDPGATERKINVESLARVMRVIRRQRGVRAETDPDTAKGRDQ